MKKYILLVVSVLTVVFVAAQNQNLTVQSLVGTHVDTILKHHLEGKGVLITNGKFNNVAGNVTFPQIGTFNRNGYSSFPFETGLVLTTGNVSVAAGPNNSGSASQQVSPYYQAPWLLNYTTGTTVTSAAVLEFDFIAMADTFAFNYIFASEEYCEYSNSPNVNDVFAFILHGYDPVTYQITDKNVAIVPGSITASNPNGTPVSIGTINHGTHSSGSTATNPEYFICNNNNTYGIQYDGYTVSLAACAAILGCQTYHMTLGISNVGDFILDSGVFLEEGSFYSPHVAIEEAWETEQGGDTLIQNCRDLDLTFTIERPALTGSTKINFETDPASTATLGSDYAMIKPDGTEITQEYNSFFYPIGDTLQEVHVVMLPTVQFPEGVTTKTATIYVRTQGCDGIPDLADLFYFEDTITLYFRANDSIQLRDTSVTVCDLLEHIEVEKVRGSDSIDYQWYSSSWVPNPPGIANPHSLVTDCDITDTHTYYVVATDRNGGCLADTATVQVNIVPKPTFEVTYTPDHGCMPLQVTMQAQYTPAYANVYWDISNNNGFDYIDSVATIRPTLSEPGNYSISMLVVSAPGCDSSFTYSNVIHVSDFPHADFTYSPAEPENGQEITFTNLSTGDDITSFAWNFGDGHSSFVEEPTHTYHLTESELMNVLLTVTNADGCSDDTLQVLSVEDNFAFFTSNAFSPNSDGINDIFLPVVNDVVDYELTIYTRSGEMIFYSNSTGIGWDGNIKGDPAPEGIYIWKIQFAKIGTPEVMHTKTGTVTIVR